MAKIIQLAADQSIGVVKLVKYWSAASLESIRE
jgi:hypothetical protein